MMLFGLVASGGYAAQAAPAQPPSGSVAAQATVDLELCLYVQAQGYLGQDGLVLDVNALVAAALTLGLTPDQLSVIIEGGCAPLLAPTPTPAPPETLPTLPPYNTPTPLPPTQVPPTEVPPTAVPPTAVPPTLTPTLAPPTLTPTLAPPTLTPTTAPTVVTPDPNTDGTVNIAKFYCNGVTDTVFQAGDISAAAIPSSAGECQPGSATFTFYFIGDQTADNAQLVVDGTGTIGLPAGEYEVVEEGTQARTVITVADGGILNMIVTNPTDDALPTIPADQGTVNAARFFCTGLTDTVWQASFVGGVGAAADIPSTAGDCEAGSTTFTFYLVGDGTADNAQLSVDGSGTIGLPAGDYEVVDEVTQSHTFITVIAGSTLSLVASSPLAEPVPTEPVVTPDPNTEATVNIAKFYCDGLFDVVWQGGGVLSAAADIPTSQGRCTPGAATFTFYFVGDGTNAYAQVVVDGNGSVGLPAGEYEVVEEETQARTTITVFDGEIYSLVVSNPTGDFPTPDPNGDGTVNIAKFYCTGIDDPIFLSDYIAEFMPASADVNDGGIPTSAGQCWEGSATLTFYLVGDGTDDHAQVVVDGATTVGLPAGEYEVVEEETQARALVDVYANTITSLVVLNPAGDQPTPTVTAEPTHGPKPTHAPRPQQPTAVATSAVKELPNTGQGSDSGSNMAMVAMLAGASILLAAGALSRRRTR